MRKYYGIETLVTACTHTTCNVGIFRMSPDDVANYLLRKLDIFYKKIGEFTNLPAKGTNQEV